MRDRRPRAGGGWRSAVFAAGVLATVLSARTEDAAAQPVSVPTTSRTEAVSVRAGNHPGFGRLVFDVAGNTKYRLSRDGDHVHLGFSPAVVINDPRFMPHNVLSVSGGVGGVELVVAAGARVRPSRIGERVVVDVIDPAGSPEAKPDQAAAAELPVPPVPLDIPPPVTAAERPSQPAPAQPEPDTVPPPVVPKSTMGAAPPAEPLPASMPSAPAAAASVPDTPGPSFLGPVALAAVRTTPAEAGKGVAFSVPFGADIGAAALRRGDLALVVFDQRRPVDLAALRADPILGTASVQLLPAATLIRLRLPPGMEVALLRRSSRAWTVAVVPNVAPIRPIRAALAPDDAASPGRARVLLPGDAPGEVVSLADPDTGATLLLGTQRQPGQGIAATRRTPRYVLLPTWQGVAVQPLADSLSLRTVKDGFILTGADLPPFRTVAADTESLDAAAGLTRRFNFQMLTPDALQRRLQAEIADAAFAPARARGRKRLAVAQTMISLGLGAEAQAVLQLAAEDDPAVAASADAAGLGAIAALLAGRIGDTGPIDDPRLSGTDEIALWRAVRAADRQEGSPRAAAAFAATLPLVLAYPPGMRDRLLPVVIETMIAGGETAAVAPALAQQKDNPDLGLARAMKLEADGNVDGALAAYHAVVQGRDRRQRALAASREVELRLASHRIDAAAAADALDRQLYDWRGDQHELALRERVAALRAESGAWRPALALLRETLSIFPDHKAEIHTAMQTMFAGLLRGKAADTLAPLDLVSLLDENADLLADMQNRPQPESGVSANALQAKLAEKLLALDLPSRAGPQLQRLMQAAPQGAGRAGFGATLAALKLREGDAKGALETLAASEPEAAADWPADSLSADTPPPDTLPASLVERRALLFAKASARTGDRAKALAALAPLNTPAADELRSMILERAGDWPAATRSLADQAAKLVPADGKLDDTQRRLLVRLASAASQAGDDALLEQLRTRDSPRMASGPLADMFKLLTADRVHSAADLQRAGREMALARTLPAGIRALEPSPAGVASAR